MMHYYWDYGNGGNDPAGLFYMLFMLLLIFIGAIITVHYIRRDFNGKPGEDEAIALLKKRYANGDIDKKEFEEKRKDLKK